MSDQDLVLVEHDGPIAIVTLNRPEALNALSQALSRRITETFAELRATDARVAILTGAGRAFCAGVDLKELALGGTALQRPDEAEGAGHRRFGMAAFGRPVIAAVNGFAITGGLELALCCDMRLASSAARFSDTHARVGVIPGGRMTALLPRLIGLGRAKEMSLGGNAIDADTAERWGLVNRVVAPDALLPVCRRLAHDIAAIDPDYIRRYDGLIEANYGMSYAEAIDNEHRHSREANQHFDPAGFDRDAIAARARGGD